jgi:hypothetical protein
MRPFVEIYRLGALLGALLLVIPIIALMAACVGSVNLEEEWQ